MNLNNNKKKGTVCAAIGSFSNPEYVVKEIMKENENIIRVGIISANVRGYSEIYFELSTKEEASSMAFGIHSLPAPIRGIHFEEWIFEDLKESDNFKQLDGKIFEREMIK